MNTSGPMRPAEANNPWVSFSLGGLLECPGCGRALYLLGVGLTARVRLKIGESSLIGSAEHVCKRCKVHLEVEEKRIA